MKTGWKEVARLGAEGAGYPHVLVDSHGWGLRLGPDPRKDDKYYTGLPTLLQGAIEHGVRRSLIDAATASGLEELCRQVENALRSVADQRGTLLDKVVLQTPIGRLAPSGTPFRGWAAPGVIPCDMSSGKPILAIEERCR